MRFRPITTDGDLLPVTHIDDMDMGRYAVADSVISRLRLLYGEWFEDREEGFRVPDFLFNGTKSTVGAGFLTSYIGSYISKTENVIGVDVQRTDIDRHDIALNVDLQTAFGEFEDLEVNENVLLQAIR